MNYSIKKAQNYQWWWWVGGRKCGWGATLVIPVVSTELENWDRQPKSSSALPLPHEAQADRPKEKPWNVRAEPPRCRFHAALIVYMKKRTFLVKLRASRNFVFSHPTRFAEAKSNRRLVTLDRCSELPSHQVSHLHFFVKMQKS